MVEVDECREQLLEELINETEIQRYISKNEVSFLDLAVTLMEQPSHRVDRLVKALR